jgi:hypothetical protein
MTDKDIHAASETDDLGEVALTAAANDRLLKALIALFALKDPAFIKELQTIFALAAREDSVIGDASEATWGRVAEEIHAIRRFLSQEGPEMTFNA